MKIYPDVDIEIIHYVVDGRSVTRVTLETYLRRKHYGKYYLQKFWKQSEFDDEIHMWLKIIDDIRHFYAGIYKSIILGKVDLKLIFPLWPGPNRKAFQKDPDQQGERERIAK